MLRVYDLNQKSVGVFQDYDGFLGFITTLENQKRLEDQNSSGCGNWTFAHYTPEKLKHICTWIKPGFLTAVQLKALEEELGIIEICRGNSAAVQEIPVTPELDVEELRKGFCLDYCRQQKWRLIEIFEPQSSRHTAAEDGRNIVYPYTRKTRLSQQNLNNLKGIRLKAALDCCIDRLRQKNLVANSIPTPPKNNSLKGEF